MPRTPSVSRTPLWSDVMHRHTPDTLQAAAVDALKHKAGTAVGVPAPEQYVSLFGGFAAKIQQRLASE